MKIVTVEMTMNKADVETFLNSISYYRAGYSAGHSDGKNGTRMRDKDAACQFFGIEGIPDIAQRGDEYKLDRGEASRASSPGVGARYELAFFLARKICSDWLGPMAHIPPTIDECKEQLAGWLEDREITAAPQPTPPVSGSAASPGVGGARLVTCDYGPHPGCGDEPHQQNSDCVIPTKQRHISRMDCPGDERCQCCVGCGKKTDYKCPFCLICKRIDVFVCENQECREKHEASSEGCARTAQIARVLGPPTDGEVALFSGSRGQNKQVSREARIATEYYSEGVKRGLQELEAHMRVCPGAMIVEKRVWHAMNLKPPQVDVLVRHVDGKIEILNRNDALNSPTVLEWMELPE